MKLTPWMLTVAAFAIICLLATLFLFKKLWATEVVIPPKVESRTLPMAITEIEPGTIITMKHIGNGKADPNQKLASDTFLGIDAVVGRIAKTKIPAAVPLEGNMFYAVGDFPDIDIDEHKRAVTINVNDSTAILSGMIKVGQYVDVHMTTDANVGTATRLQSTGGTMGSAGDPTAMTLTLFKGIKVVKLNHTSGTTALQGGPSHNVTLELDEDQSRIMLLAQQKGQIDLTYNPNGEGVGGLDIKSEDDRVTLKQLLGIKELPPEKKPLKIEHYRGGGHSTSYWKDGERVDYQGGSGDGTSGTRLQSTGGDVGGWSTDNKPVQRSNDLTQEPSAASKL